MQPDAAFSAGGSSATSDPKSEVVALVGGRQHRHAFFYADWLVQRLASRRLRYPLDHPDGASRCYLPTDETYEHPTARVTDEFGQKRPALTRVWAWVEPEQWTRWGREYRTPEEASENSDGIEAA
ncbi:hypothetical protein Lesp02_85340 [Lentzea sp. NBRC 105346]|uniref:hypothetical protein n=1 Tax=Lentzea sp. NBRC 105346 TaxID=3032205 RepID=UPI0024A2D6FE|nr:hypothetical protein [Lentzea sp. NBRC 105346]GLZ36347.1 hypothetical protein Lesp02_85340 [Lentzea sp. NBRC 105346]